MEDNQAAVEAAAADGRDFVTETDMQQSEAPARPEWLPEKFNTPEDLAKSYSELQSKLGTKEEDIRKSIMEEIQNEAFADRPEKAGDYQMPESIDAESAVDNELLQWWAEHSFENGFSQSEFEQGIEMYAQAINANQPDLKLSLQSLVTMQMHELMLHLPLQTSSFLKQPYLQSSACVKRTKASWHWKLSKRP